MLWALFPLQSELVSTQSIQSAAPKNARHTVSKPRCAQGALAVRNTLTARRKQEKGASDR